MDPDLIFPEVTTCSLEEIFGVRESKNHKKYVLYCTVLYCPSVPLSTQFSYADRYFPFLPLYTTGTARGRALRTGTRTR